MNNKILNEAYVGKLPQLLMAERQVQIMIDKQKGKKYSLINLNKLMKPELDKIGIIFSELFNVEYTTISITPESSTINAFTFPLQSQTNKIRKDFFKLKKSSNGHIRFADKTNKEMLIYINQFDLNRLSAEEVMFMLLHEVGHNFYLVPQQILLIRSRLIVSEILRMVPRLIKALFTLNLDLFVKTLVLFMGSIIKTIFGPQKVMKFLNKLGNEIPGIYQGRKIIANVKTLVEPALVPVIKVLTLPAAAQSVLALPSVILLNTVPNFLDALMNDSYNAEKFCDQFAASYGYAVAGVSSFNNNRSEVEISQNKNPVISLLANLHDVMSAVSMIFCDPYPERFKRAELLNQRLKHELEVNKPYLTKNQIKDIESQIAEVDAILSKESKNNYSNFLKLSNQVGLTTIRDWQGRLNKSDRDHFEYTKSYLKQHIDPDFK